MNITYADKNKDAADGIRDQWKDEDANEVKNAVNSKMDNSAYNSDIGFVTVNTSVSPISLDFNGRLSKLFKGSLPISTDKTWTLANAGAASKIVSLRFITNGGVLHTFPESFKMNDALWNSGAKTWAPIDAGEYEASASYDGAVWALKIEGPFN